MRRLLIVVAVAFVALLPARAQTVKIIGIRVAAPFCGDGRIDSGEDCDGSNIGSHTCAEFSCSTGTPTCNGSCVITATGCGTCTTGDLLDEDFTGSQTDGTTAGFTDASWTRYGDGATGDTPIPNPNATSTDGCPTTTGWAGDCLKFTINPNHAAFHDIAERNDFAATAGGVWLRTRTKQSFTLGVDTHYVGVLSIGTSASAFAAGSIFLAITRNTGPAYVLTMGVTGGVSVGTAFTIATGDSICLEAFLSSTTNTAEWWVNGTSMGSAVDAVNLIVAPTTLWLGPYTPPSGADDSTQFWDAVQVSSSGRLACN
jgi:hypothetical protein